MVAGRVALLYSQRDGYLNNLYPAQAPDGLAGGSPGSGAGADMGDDDTLALRGTLDFRLNEDLLFRVSANYARSKLATGPYQSKSTIGVVDANGELINVIDTPAGETRLTIQGDGDAGADAIDGDQFLPGAGIGLGARLAPGGDFFGYIDPDGEGLDTSGDFAFEDNGEVETFGLNARFEWDLSAQTTLTSISDFKDYSKSLFIDVDSAPMNQLANYAGVDATSFTQELRLGGSTEHMRWVAGLYYLNIDNQSDNGLKAPVNSIVGTFATPVDIGTVSELETNSYSLFGQLEYDLTPRLTGIVGLRGIREEKEFQTLIGVFLSEGNFGFNRGQLLNSPFGEGSPFRYSDEVSKNLWAAKLQLDYRASDDLLYGDRKSVV